MNFVGIVETNNIYGLADAQAHVIKNLFDNAAIYDSIFEMVF